MCWEEVRKRGRKRRVNLDWEREREEFFEKRGLSLEEVEKKRNGKEHGSAREKGKRGRSRERRYGGEDKGVAV